MAAFLLEIVFLFGGIYLYMKATRPITRGGRHAMGIFGSAMLPVQGIVFFDSPPASDRSAAITALLCYSVFAGAAYWLERKPSPLGVVQRITYESAF